MANGFFTDTTLCIGCKACEVACKQWNQLPADGYSLSGMSYDNTVDLNATTWRHVKFIEQLGHGAASEFGLGATSEPGERSGRFGGTGQENGHTDEVHNGHRALGGSSGPGADAVSNLVAQGPRVVSMETGSLLGENRWLMMSDVCKHCSHAGCLEACPTGALIRNEFGDVYVQPDICNGCGYCVSACPFGVIALNEADGRAWKCTLCYDRQKDGFMPACAKACPTQSIQFGDLDELRERARRRVGMLHERGITDAYLYGVDEDTSVGNLNAFFLLVDEPNVYNLPEKPHLPQAQVVPAYVATIITGIVLGMATLLALGRGRTRQ